MQYNIPYHHRTLGRRDEQPDRKIKYNNTIIQYIPKQ